MISVQVLTSLADVRARHCDVLGYAAQQNLFASIEWFQCLAQYGYPSPIVPRIYVASDDETPNEIGFLFCAADDAHRSLASLTNYYTMEFSLVFGPTAQQRQGLAESIVVHIAAERPRWRQVNLRLLRDDDPAAAWLEDALRNNGFAPHKYFQFENYNIDIRGIDFDKYFESRPSRMKNTIRRREKKLRSEHNISIDTLDHYLDHKVKDYMAVYEHSWKQAEGSPEFIFALCRMAADLGLLRLGLLYVDSIPAAAQLWLQSGPKAIIYKLAYDEKFSDFSVGSILTRDVLEFVLTRDRVAELDYGVGSEPYKRDWMDRTRRIVGIEANNRRTMSGLAHGFGQWARRVAKTLMLRAAMKAGS